MSTTCTACSNDTAARKMTKKDKKIEKVMHEYGAGELKSSSGDKVTNQKQAVAIAMSEARRKKK